MDRIGKARLKALGLSYRAYLASDHWKAFRKSMGPSPACLACGAKRRVQLHHLTYERLGRERKSDVVPLCARHHRSLHNHQKAHRKLYLTLSAIIVVLKRK